MFSMTAIGFVMGVVMVKTQSQLMAGLLLLWLVLSSIHLSRIRCPRCRTQVGEQGRVAGVPVLGSFPRRHCSRCGADLTLPEG
jgi:hypothetical protein